MEKLFVCRLASPGWDTFTGSLGHGAVFENGLSVEALNFRQIARIGSNFILLNEETGEQVGPSAVHNFIQSQEIAVAPELKNADQEAADLEFDRQKLAEDEKARADADAAALAAAQEKAMAQIEEAVIYSRSELEAIGAANGIAALREIASPLGVRGRAIGELIEEILKAQTKLAVS